MKVAIVTSQAPFVQGGAELLAQWLADNLQKRGHEAQVVRIPFRWYPPERILDHILAARLLRFDGADRVVAMKFPAYYVRHHTKVLWLLHQFRQAYDLLGTEYAELEETPEGRRVRQAIVTSDAAFLPEAERIYTNSEVTSKRLREFNGLGSRCFTPRSASRRASIPTATATTSFARAEFRQSSVKNCWLRRWRTCEAAFVSSWQGLPTRHSRSQRSNAP